MFSGQSDFRVTTLKFYPKDHNVFLCGGFSSEIKAWDMRTGKVTPFFFSQAVLSRVWGMCMCVCIAQRSTLGFQELSSCVVRHSLTGTWALLMRETG